MAKNFNDELDAFLSEGEEEVKKPTSFFTKTAPKTPEMENTGVNRTHKKLYQRGKIPDDKSFTDFVLNDKEGD